MSKNEDESEAKRAQDVAKLLKEKRANISELYEGTKAFPLVEAYLRAGDVLIDGLAEVSEEDVNELIRPIFNQLIEIFRVMDDHLGRMSLPVQMAENLGAEVVFIDLEDIVPNADGSMN